MELSLLNLGLAAGAALAAVPVILHLVLRQKPKHLIFPALRLIQARHLSNRRKLRLRHLLLLALRMLVIMLMALALARPVVRSAGFISDQEAPVAATLVFDTSLGMQYRHENETRLERAQHIARELLPKLPERSEVAVLDSAGGPALFQIDFNAVRGRIEGLEPAAGRQEIADSVVEALKLLEASPQLRRELYLFSDLARPGWQDSGAEIQALAERIDNLSVYVLNVGVEEPMNFSVSSLVPSAQVLPRNSELQLRVTVEAAGTGGKRTVELYLDDGRGQEEPQKRGQHQVELSAGEASEVVFAMSGLGGPVHQGYVQLLGGDPLPFDDVRYLTLEVRPAMRVLIVADPPDDAFYWREALAPQEMLLEQRTRWIPETVRPDRLAEKVLDSYAAVCLVNVRQLSRETWEQLARYVTDGGGLAVLPGSDVQPDAYNTPAAQRVLPGRFSASANPARPVYLNPANYSHPVLAWFRKEEGGDMPLLPVRRYFPVQLDGSTSTEVMAYDDSAPALVERRLGKGRVLLLTTSVDYDPSRSENDRWNELPTGWSFVALADRIMLYLSGSTGQKLNYEAGESVVLSLEPGVRLADYVLVPPDGREFRRTADPNQSSLLVTGTDQLGHYRIRGGSTSAGFQKGFSVNPSPEESTLTPVAPEELERLFGPDRLHVVSNAAGLERAVGEARVGREVFPLLVLLVVVMLAAEQWLANRFYRSAPDAPAGETRQGPGAYVA